jgi:hypothetical protein
VFHQNVSNYLKKGKKKWELRKLHTTNCQFMLRGCDSRGGREYRGIARENPPWMV